MKLLQCTKRKISAKSHILRKAIVKNIGLFSALSVTLLFSQMISAEETIKIALSTAKTGPVAQYGDMHRAGVHIAVEAINSRGGVLGKKIEIVELDDACNVQQTVDIANQVVTSGIKFVLGPLCSGVVPAAAKIYNENNIVMVAATASSDDLSRPGYQIFFRTIGKDEQQGVAAGNYLVGKIKPKALAIIYEDQAYGQDLAQQVKNVVEAGGLKPVLVEEFKKGSNDFSALLTKLKQLNVDQVYYGGYHPELIVMLKQAEEQKLKIKWMGPGGVASPAVKGSWAEGLLVTLPPDVSKVPENASVIGAFIANQQDPTGSFVMTSYASMEVLADAIKRANSEDPLKVADFMHKNSFKTVLGEVAFTDKGDNAKARFDIFIWHQDASKSIAP